MKNNLIEKENLNPKEWLITIIVFVVALIVIFFLTQYIINLNKDKKAFEKSKTYIETECSVVGYIVKRHRNVFEYNVSGKEYKHYYKNTFQLYLGEKYKIRYNPERPEISIVDITKPIIDSSSYEKIFGEILSIDTTLNKNSVVFTYIVNGEKYGRELYVKDASQYIIGKEYNIIYNIKRPGISYISDN